MTINDNPGSHAWHRRRHCRLCAERLDDRTVPTVITVTTSAMNLDSDGKVSLWEAVAAANLNIPFVDAPAGSAGLDTIRFATSLNGQTIGYTPAIVSDGLTIAEDLTIDGPGAGLLTISGNNIARIFRVNPIAHAEIRGLTLTRGSQSQGGAILNPGNLTLVNTILTSNTATEGGSVYNTGTLTVLNSTVAGNTALTGGGIYNAGILTVTNDHIAGNTATGGIGGGGIYNAGTLTVTGGAVVGNSARSGGGGGGISAGGTSNTITGATIASNAAGIGGGIYGFGADNLTIANCAIVGNSASGHGGGVYSTQTTIINTTIASNAAPFGGGIINIGTLSVTNSTIAGNSGPTGGGGIFNYDGFGGGTANLTSTIVAGNSANTSGADLYGPPYTLESSLIQRMDGFTFTELAPGSNIFGLDPLLGPLAYNGGLMLTHALLPGSPALDRGSNPDWLSEAQRVYGAERVIGAAADIGAYESRDADVRLVPDPLDRTKNVLVVIGTRKSDTIALRPDDGDIEVTLNSKFFAFDPEAVGRAAAFGMEGNDKITSALDIGTLLDGGRGTDTLTGGSAADILIGGAGSDVLQGGAGRDILIGGDGIDRLAGGADDDLLVGGRTVYDNDQRALSQIVAVWTSADSYATRAASLLAGTGVPALSAAQVTDGYTDVLAGDGGQELMYAGPGDQVQNRIAAENLVKVNPPSKTVRK